MLEASVSGAVVARFGDVVERNSSRGNAADFRSIEIGREREKPGGEDRILAPLAERTVGAQKGLLRHLFGTAAITTKAVGEVDEGPLPA